MSDGQRRRVQICLGLLKPFRVLLCDEITVDLDVLGRLDLLQFFVEETEQARARQASGRPHCRCRRSSAAMLLCARSARLRR